MRLNLDDFKLKDKKDFIDFQVNHKNTFLDFCKGHPYVGVDDELDNDLDFIVKALEFFDKRGYIEQN